MSTSFKDTDNRTWSLELNVATLKRVKSLTEVDLLNIQDGSTLMELSRNPMQLVDVLWAIVMPQAQPMGVNDEQFGTALGGMALRDASEAFLEAITNFTLGWQPALGATLAKLHTKLNEMDLKAEQLTKAKLADPRVDEAIEKTYEKVEAEMEAALANLSTDGK
jgi:hypothetical protein